MGVGRGRAHRRARALTDRLRDFRTTKKGAKVAPFRADPGVLTASSPSSWSPSSPSSSPLSLSPPSGVLGVSGIRAARPPAAAAWLDRQRCRRPRSLYRDSPRHVSPRAPHPKKRGCGCTPGTGDRLSASWRSSSSRRPLQSSSPFFLLGDCGSSACFPVPRGHKRWAERSTYIQDVDYG